MSRSRTRKWLRRVVISAGVLLLLLGAAVAWVLGTQRGTELAAERALRAYSNAVEGSIGFDHVEGSVGDEVCVHGLRLADAEDRELVVVGRACAELKLHALLGRAIAVEWLTAEDVEVHLWHDANWRDLARDRPRTSNLPGPDLRAALRGPIEVRRFSLVRHDEDGERTIVHHAGLVGELAAEGRSARVSIAQLWGYVEPTQTFVAAAAGELRWNAPSVFVEELVVVSSRGVVSSLHGTLHTLDKRYDVDVAGTAVVPPGTAKIRGPVAVHLVGGGDWRGAAVAIGGDSPEYGTAGVGAVASFEGGVTVGAVGAVEPASHLGLPTGVVAAAGHVDGAVRRVDGVVAALDTVATVHLEGPSLRGRAVTPGALATVDATLGDGGLERLEGHVDVSSAAAATRQLRRVLARDIPEVEGSGHGRIACHRTDPWHCRVEADVRRDGDRLATRADVVASPGDVAIEIEQLRGQLRGQPIRLLQPAGVRLSDRAVDIRDVRLAAAGGRIEASGSLAANGPSRLTVDLKRLDLATIEDFAPQTKLRGQLGGELLLTGTPGRPDIDATLTATHVRWGERRLGRGKLVAHHEDETAEARLEWTHQEAHASAFVRLPLRVNLDHPGVALRSDKAGAGSLELERFDLELLRPFVDAPALDGRIDATVHAAGAISAPTVVARLVGSHLAYEEHALGNAALDLGYKDGSARAELKLIGSDGEAEISAAVPVRIDLSAPRVLVHDPDGEHVVRARVERLELGQLPPRLLGVAVGGIVGGEVQAVAVGGEARVDVAIVGRKLSVRDEPLGAAAIEAHLDRDAAIVQGQLSGGLGRLAEVKAELPLQLRGPTRAPTWRSDRPVKAGVELTDVDGASLGRLLGTHALSGQIDARIQLAGSPADPFIEADAHVETLYHRGRSLGMVEAEARYREEELVARLVQENGVQQVAAHARIPVTIDLAEPTVAWHRHGDHHIHVHAAGIDEASAGTFVELPSDVRFLMAAELEAWGTIDDPTAMIRLRGSTHSSEAVGVPVTFQAALRARQQRARLTVGSRGPVGLVVNATAEAPLASVLAGETAWTDVELDAEAVARDFHMSELAPLLPSALHDPRGKLQLQATATGPLGSPRLRGKLEMDGGEFTLVPFNQRFRDVDLHVNLDGADVEVERFTARSGNGRASATAHLHIAPRNTRGGATVEAHELPIVRPGLPAMTLDTRLELDLDARGDRTRIEVAAYDGFIDVLELKPGDAAQKIPEDDGVRYVDRKGRRLASREADEEARTPWIPRDVVVVAHLADPLRVRGPNADMDWTGRVEVRRGHGGETSASGRFVTTGGRVALLGNDFDLQRGEVRLLAEGELDPFIDLRATTDTPEALVTMIVRGRVSRPTLELRSDPPFPETDLFALLITGQTHGAGGEDSEYAAKAASLLAAVQNPRLQQQLRDITGIDRVGVGFGDSVEAPVFTIGKRLTRKVYVEATYHHNAPEDENQAELRLEYRFKPPRWSVDTYFGDAAEGGVGLWWTRRFGGSRPKPRQTGQVDDSLWGTTARARR